MESKYSFWQYLKDDRKRSYKRWGKSFLLNDVMMVANVIFMFVLAYYSSGKIISLYTLLPLYVLAFLLWTNLYMPYRNYRRKYINKLYRW